MLPRNLAVARDECETKDLWHFVLFLEMSSPQCVYAGGSDLIRWKKW